MLVIPSIHKLLAANPLYDYARLYALVAAFTPDLVGVEIRQEDLERPETYLKHNYPQEMIVLEGLYQDRVFGFDWLGDELKGRAVPDDWWTRQSHIKQLERTCSAASPATSPVAAALNARIAELSRQQENLLQTASAASLSEGPYDAVTTEYYRLVAQMTRGTPCEEVSRWYARRDHEIAANIAAAVLQHPGRRIAIVTGADHHGPVVKALSRLGPLVALVRVSDYT